MDDPRAATPATNIPEFTVSEISGAIKRTLEGNFARIRVRGEITELKRYPSGHIYFSLKDEGGKVAGVVWKFSVPKLGLSMENGVEVIAQGKISSYGERSSYQLIVERMEYAGAGALLARIEMLRVRLAAEGLFDADRKLPIPILPLVIGVVTSAQGAVIQDIRTTVLRRFPRRILIWPVPVQGNDAAARIAAAIAGFDAIVAGGDVPRPDVLIVARGGGSLEDLMAFNEEIVLRAVAACTIPLISAVGHETDTTLIDYVSDRRAPTPTAAAEMAVPARVELAADLAQKSARLGMAIGRLTQERRMALQQAERGLPDLPGLVGAARQRMDDRTTRLALALPNFLAARRAALHRAERGMPDLPGMLATARQGLRDRSGRLATALPGFLAVKRSGLHLGAERLRSALRHATASRAAQASRVLVRLSAAPIRAQLREQQAHLRGLSARLESVSYAKVLERGFALVSDGSGVPVTSAAKVKPGADLRIRFGDGEVRATASGGATKRQGALPL
jgi:exodeoxyribonuclease VII large subunit